ncbi:tRNA threonylcarbamoyladenosine dehydratase [Sulfidibacter corallicola]|uniref:tRNA threonylcarbamoyladenosine dehydratase n=1 Tax=Sulfidibacter corallicola TaxID=2818388 RepID=A0A8A4TEA5_SULCO|nr:tRNA threonylcarbamoyladenosine dehydratase [Sulfidibacter corallicola]QTD47953.1 tRNA threonylcarbamoyladenosine dehydratase [Sulfidibacter corallicola]
MTEKHVDQDVVETAQSAPDETAAANHFPFLAFEDPRELEDYKLHRRFDRMGRLVGDSSMKRLQDAHVMVIGLGGVGSYAAEMIVRSGIGKISIVDFDLVCITNVNRQLHAMKGVIGKPKCDVLATRFADINPKAEIVPINKFYNWESSAELLDLNPDYVIDAIDSVTAKAHLLNACRERKIKVVSSSGAAGRMDPTRLAIADLSETTVDPLARQIRKILRTKYDFPRDAPFDIPTVYSTEPITQPKELLYDNGQGFRCVCPQGQNEFFTCDDRNVIYGTAGFVTGAFGFTAASVVVRDISGTSFWSRD